MTEVTIRLPEWLWMVLAIMVFASVPLQLATAYLQWKIHKLKNQR